MGLDQTIYNVDNISIPVKQQSWPKKQIRATTTWHLKPKPTSLAAFVFQALTYIIARHTNLILFGSSTDNTIPPNPRHHLCLYGQTTITKIFWNERLFRFFAYKVFHLSFTELLLASGYRLYVEAMRHSGIRTYWPQPV